MSICHPWKTRKIALSRDAPMSSIFSVRTQSPGGHQGDGSVIEILYQCHFNFHELNYEFIFRPPVICLPVILGSPSHGQEIDGESGEVDLDVFRSGPATVSSFLQEIERARSPA